RGLFDLPPLRHRPAGRRRHKGRQTRARRSPAGKGAGMIPRRGRFRRSLTVMGSAFGSIGHLARGLWRGGSEKRLMLPLAIFLCVLGFLLILAAGVEALAPFIYSIF